MLSREPKKARSARRLFNANPYGEQVTVLVEPGTIELIISAIKAASAYMEKQREEAVRKGFSDGLANLDKKLEQIIDDISNLGPLLERRIVEEFRNNDLRRLSAVCDGVRIRIDRPRESLTSADFSVLERYLVDLELWINVTRKHGAAVYPALVQATLLYAASCVMLPKERRWSVDVIRQQLNLVIESLEALTRLSMKGTGEIGWMVLKADRRKDDAWKLISAFPKRGLLGSYRRIVSNHPEPNPQDAVYFTMDIHGDLPVKEEARVGARFKSSTNGPLHTDPDLPSYRQYAEYDQKIRDIGEAQHRAGIVLARLHDICAVYDKEYAISKNTYALRNRVIDTVKGLREVTSAIDKNRVLL